MSSWTYSENPGTSTRDAVRFAIGDTDAQDPLLWDEEIDFAIAEHGTVLGASQACVRAIVAKLAKEMDRTVGALSASFSQRHEHYKELLVTISSQVSESLGAPYAGGISTTDKQAQRSDQDHDELRYVTKGMMDNPDAGVTRW